MQQRHNTQQQRQVRKVFKIAAQYRQAFKTDVVLDVIGYRRYAAT